MKKDKFFWNSNMNGSNLNWVADVSFSNTSVDVTGYSGYGNVPNEIILYNTKDLSELPKTAKIKTKGKKK
jgi:hypothetical protein